MSWKEDLSKDLQSLRNEIQENKYCLGENVDNLEEGENSRRQERNDVLSRTFNKIMTTLNDVDKKLVDQIKTDAYDTTRKLDKLEREVTKLIAAVEKTSKTDEVTSRASFTSLESRLAEVDVNYVNGLCDVSLGYNEMDLYGALQSAVNSVTGIYLKNEAFDPGMFQVSTIDTKRKKMLQLSNTDYAYFSVTSRPANFSDFILKNMIVQAFATENSFPILFTTALEMKRNNQIKIEGTNEIILKVARPPGHPRALMCLHVSLFNTVLKGSLSCDSPSSDLNQTDLQNLTSRVNSSLNTAGRNGFYQFNESTQAVALGTQATKKCSLSLLETEPAKPTADCNDSHSVSKSAMPTFDGNDSNLAMPILGCNDSFPSAQSAMPSMGCNGTLPPTESAMPRNFWHDSFPPPDSAMPSKKLSDSFASAESAMPSKQLIDSFAAAESAMPVIGGNDSFPATVFAMPVAATLPRVNTVRDEGAPSTPPVPVFGVPTGGNLAKVPNLSDVREVTGEADVTVFSPHSDKAMVSTMRATSMASMLSGVLEDVHSVIKPGDTSSASIRNGGSEEAEEYKKPKVTVEHDDDMECLVASAKGLSIEEMQKSLSSSEGSRNEVDLLEVSEVPDLPHNRSVSFAPKTKIIQALTTPQPGEVKARFRIDQGNTKVKDGQAGVVRRLNHQKNDQNQEELEDPHLYLNASKAPTLADQSLSCDPAWNCEEGAVHEWEPPSLRSHQSNIEMSHETSLNVSNVSVWDRSIKAPEDISEFNLALGLVEQLDVYLPGDLGQGKGCLQSPVNVEYVQTFGKFLISEPEYHRVGVYSKRSASFQGWFGSSTEAFNYPTNIVHMNNGYTALVERGQINVYDKSAKFVQKIGGNYNGLAAAHGGDFVTAQKTQDAKTHIVVIGQINGKGSYVIKEKVTISVIADKIKSKVRFLAVHGTKVYASDYELNSIYVVDMFTKSQNCWETPCSSPCGMLVDDVGNLLVADSGNNRLVVFNEDGELQRQFGSQVRGAASPCGVVKVKAEGMDGEEEDHILVTYSGTDGTDGRCVRFKCS